MKHQPEVFTAHQKLMRKRKSFHYNTSAASQEKPSRIGLINRNRLKTTDESDLRGMKFN